MPSLASRVSFARRFVTNKEGTRWSLKKREWVRDQYWLPSDGYKLWRPEKGEACGACKDRIGSIIEHPYDNPTWQEGHKHSSDECRGLDVYPIIVTLLNLIRQDGKTFNGMAQDVSDMALGRNMSIALLAASEDQVLTILKENYVEAIQNNKKLNKRFQHVGMRVVNEKTNSFIEALPASAKSVTSRTRRRVRIDEARDVPSEVAWALIPAIQAMSGIECPRGHVSRINADDAMAALRSHPGTCNACGERLQPFFGRVIAASSSGVKKDDSDDHWFHELIEQCEKEPSPYVHVFRSSTPLNPAKSPVVQNALMETFGGLQAMKHFVNADMTNEWTTKGDDFLTTAEIDRCMFKDMVPLDECGDPCVGFLDTSDSVEKTSLVLLASDPIGTAPWERVYTPRVDWWDPSKMPGGVIDERLIEAHMKATLPMFTGLRILGVDTRGRPWAQRLVKTLRSLGFTFVEAWDKSTPHESDAGWSEFGMRIRSQTMRMLYVPEIRTEIRGVRVKKREDKPDKITDKNRRKSHKDITEALALACYLAAMERLKRRTGIGHTRQLGKDAVAQKETARTTLARMAGRGPLARGFGGENSY